MIFSRCESLRSTRSECSSTSGQEKVLTDVTKGWDGDSLLGAIVIFLLWTEEDPRSRVVISSHTPGCQSWLKQTREGDSAIYLRDLEMSQGKYLISLATGTDSMDCPALSTEGARTTIKGNLSVLVILERGWVLWEPHKRSLCHLATQVFQNRWPSADNLRFLWVLLIDVLQRLGCGTEFCCAKYLQRPRCIVKTSFLQVTEISSTWRLWVNTSWTLSAAWVIGAQQALAITVYNSLMISLNKPIIYNLKL